MGLRRSGFRRPRAIQQDIGAQQQERIELVARAGPRRHLEALRRERTHRGDSACVEEEGREQKV
ncbi:hypothetical protein WME90_10070 [Sorangium sp. So ce375]|uniref:hypothetical protein n=1 Tax=Sorangium sp. So ce375 TaxID=3133306 RepID=UPI003F5BF1DB